MSIALIIQILMAIPSLVRTIIEIIRLIKSLPKKEQPLYYAELKDIAKTMKNERKSGVKQVADTKRLETLLADLRKKSA